MLILTRKKSEKILVGDQIEITIVSVGNGYVRIGLQAPRSVRILRSELCPAAQPDGPLAKYLKLTRSVGEPPDQHKSNQSQANTASG